MIPQCALRSREFAGVGDRFWPMRDTGGASKECVGNEAHCLSDSACRVSLPVDLRGHVGYRVFIVERQDAYARIRFTASRSLESLRRQCAEKRALAAVPGGNLLARRPLNSGDTA